MEDIIQNKLKNIIEKQEVLKSTIDKSKTDFNKEWNKWGSKKNLNISNRLEETDYE